MREKQGLPDGVIINEFQLSCIGNEADHKA